MSNSADRLLVQFFSSYNQVSFSKGDVLLTPHAQPQFVYFLHKGLVSISAVRKDGGESVLTILREPSVFPLPFIMANKENRYTYTCLTDVGAYEAPPSSVAAFIRDEPLVMANIIERLSVGIDGMLSQMEQLMSGTSECRVAHVLLLLADRFGDAKDEKIVIPLSLTHPTIATMAGTSRETVTRFFNSLRRDSVLTYNRHAITILNRSKLTEMCA